MTQARKLVEVVYVYDDDFQQSYCGKSLETYVAFINAGATALMREQQQADKPEPKLVEEELPFLRDAP